MLKWGSRPGWKEVKSSAAPCPVGRTSLLCMAGNLPLSSTFAHFCLDLCYFVAGFVSFSVKAVKSLSMEHYFIPWSITDCSHSSHHLLRYHTQLSLPFFPVSDFSSDILYLYNKINYFGFLLTLKKSRNCGCLNICEKKKGQFLITSPILTQPLPAKILSN